MHHALSLKLLLHDDQKVSAYYMRALHALQYEL